MPENTSSDLTGRRITLDHSYAVEEVIHRGPMISLYAALWEPVKAPVVIRSWENLLRLGLPIGTTRRIVGNLRSDAMFLRGPGLPDVVDIGEESQFAPFHILRLPPGGLLLEHLQTGHRLEPDAVLRMVETLASALRTYRDAHTIHRGPTPDRVWMGDDGTFTLLGAGEVLYRDDTVRMKSPAVTELLWHIPPESFIGSNPSLADESDHEAVTGQLTSATRLKPSGELQGHAREDDPRAEVYALGCLAYNAINGFHPFFVNPSDPSAGVLATLQDAPLPLKGLAEDSPFARTIIQAFARNPDDRFPDPHAFVAALREAARTEGKGGPPQAELPLSTPDRIPQESAATPANDEGDVREQAESGRTSQERSRADRRPAPPGAVPLSVLRSWQAATIVILLMLVGYVAWERFQPVSIIITSDPPSIALEERVGHTLEPRGRTPVVLRDRSPLTPIELQVVGPDGSHGPPATFTPVQSRTFQDLGRCYRLPLQISFDE